MPAVASDPLYALGEAVDRFALAALEHELPPALERAWTDVARAYRLAVLDRAPPAPAKGRFERSRVEGEAIERLERSGSRAKVEARHKAVSEGYTGDACGSCGSFKMRRQGRCSTCQACGFNDGCG